MSPTSTPRCVVVDAKNILGEGTVWCMQEQAIYWIDIEGKLLQRQLPADGETRIWELPERIGSFALRQRGGIVAGFASGFAFYDLKTGDIERLASPEAHLPGNRFNDGRADRAGRFWAGTMDDSIKEPSGALYRLDPDGTCHRMDQGFCVSNSICFSPDDRTLYCADSMQRTIFAYDLDLAAGTIKNRRVFVTTEEGAIPDGSTVDAQGYLWNAQWGAGRVVRYNPSGGLDRVIELPVAQPTCCAFGGPDLHTLYVSSARQSLTAAELVRQPLAGGLFAIELGVQGLAEPRFAG